MDVLPHMRMGYHPIRVWDIVLSHTRMGVRYEYTQLYDCITSQQWTEAIPAWMHRLHACRCYGGMYFPGIRACFPGRGLVRVSRRHAYIAISLYYYWNARFPIHQLHAYKS